ncbi:MAG: hypothetical protein HWD61_12950 [Parachlamydiaceae bacterium]|nr:MAG: hypothetical protein HWD61_12950 [Parachlamydiaceae bacterium]
MSSIQPTQVQHNQPVEYNFKDLNKGHKALVVIVSIFLSIFTLGIGAWLLVPHLIGRLRKLEEGSKAAETAKKSKRILILIKGCQAKRL